MRCFFKIEMCFESLVVWKVYIVGRTPRLPWRSIGRINIFFLSYLTIIFVLNICCIEYNIKECRRKSLILGTFSQLIELLSGLWLQNDFEDYVLMFQRTILWTTEVTAVPEIQKCFFAILVEKWFYSYHWM